MPSFPGWIVVAVLVPTLMLVYRHHPGFSGETPSPPTITYGPEFINSPRALGVSSIESSLSSMPLLASTALEDDCTEEEFWRSLREG